MAKLITPVQYDPSVAGLNEVRPLQLADEVRQGIDIPVLNFTPVGSSYPADGRFARCSEQGGLLKHKVSGFENYIQRSAYPDQLDATGVIFFSRTVYKIIVYVGYNEGTTSLHWTGPVGTPLITELSLTDVSIIDFVGDIIWFKGDGPAWWEVLIVVLGFY